MASIGTEAAAQITERALNAGITVEELNAMVAELRRFSLASCSGSDAQGIKQEIAEREIHNRRNLATDAQVAYIWDLLHRGEYPSWFSGPTTYDAIQRLTRSDASMYIDSLKDAI
jgi:hypothetical protein